MSAWAHGRMSSWVHELMGAWVYGLTCCGEGWPCAVHEHMGGVCQARLRLLLFHACEILGSSCCSRAGCLEEHGLHCRHCKQACFAGSGLHCVSRTALSPVRPMHVAPNRFVIEYRGELITHALAGEYSP